MKKTIALSVIVITRNEEDNIARCLSSLPAGCEIILVDSHSDDRTREIAEGFGCHILTRSFTDFADQKNFALSHATRPWVLAIDADEELRGWRDDLLEEIEQRSFAGYHLPRRLVFMNRVMSHGKTKDSPLRLFRREKAKYVGAIHEVVKVAGQVSRSRELGLLHYSYKDLTDYFNRFNRYTSAVAANHARNQKRVPLLKHLLRPWFEFISRYLFRLGFLDGYPGYTYALASSLYAYVKYAKLLEKADPK